MHELKKSLSINQFVTKIYGYKEIGVTLASTRYELLRHLYLGTCYAIIVRDIKICIIKVHFSFMK